MIISASRRTDIPSWFGTWFRRRIDAGFVLVRNPMNHAQEKWVSLRAEDVDCFVFWTKNAIPFDPVLEYLDNAGFHSYFQYTITPYNSPIERNLPEKSRIVEHFIALSRRIGTERMVWRYDPILTCGNISAAYHIQSFAVLAKALQGHTTLCHISFVDLYRKNRSAMKELSAGSVAHDDVLCIAEKVAAEAQRRGIALRSCCETADLSQFGILPGSCIDGERVRRITGSAQTFTADKNQRSGCRCAASVDIGAYNTCGNGCAYCYANAGAGAINYATRHDPDAPMLGK
jgi:hypothetical protein